MPISRDGATLFVSYFFFIGSGGVGRFGSLGISASSHNHFLNSWLRLVPQTSLGLAWAWRTNLSSIDLGLRGVSTLSLPSSTLRYTMSRGATVSNNNSSEQFEASALGERVWLSCALLTLVSSLSNPVLWFWTIRDLTAFFLMRPAILAGMCSASLEVRDVRMSAPVPVICFVGVW